MLSLFFQPGHNDHDSQEETAYTRHMARKARREWLARFDWPLLAYSLAAFAAVVGLVILGIHAAR